MPDREKSKNYFFRIPVRRDGDADDTHFLDVFDAEEKGPRYYRLLGESYPSIEDGLKAFVQAYLACVAAVDDQIGVVVDAIDQSPFKDNTIIVVTSDHGWQNGEKDYLFKNALWEESTRIPLIIRAPGVARAGGLAEHPVSLIDLYPTLIDLCGLTGDNRKNNRGRPLDGFSMRPFLEDPAADRWDGPDGALTMVYVGDSPDTGLSARERDDPARQHWSLRTSRWRYIRYNNGAQELYDHHHDPYEWNNLGNQPEYETVREALYRQLPSHTADTRLP